jgi:hypothetical protein
LHATSLALRWRGRPRRTSRSGMLSAREAPDPGVLESHGTTGGRGVACCFVPVTVYATVAAMAQAGTVRLVPLAEIGLPDWSLTASRGLMTRTVTAVPKGTVAAWSRLVAVLA